MAARDDGAGPAPKELPFVVAGPVVDEEEAIQVGQMAVIYTWALRAQQAARSASRRMWGIVKQQRAPPRPPAGGQGPRPLRPP